MSELEQKIASYLDRLFPLCRSLTGAGNRETLEILQELIPLKIIEVPSGTEVYDWTVPLEWNINDAWVSDGAGNRLIDFKDNNLHVMSYSTPVDKICDWEELQSHLYTHELLPDAIPYRTSYYERDWAFCCTQEQYQNLRKAGDALHVHIDATLEPGSMSLGELLLPGKSEKEILISCYICHPSMANDSLSGVILTAFLARHLAALPDRRYSYRIIFVPETIGAITYCHFNETSMKAIDFGLVVTTVGGTGKFGYKQSYDAGHSVNILIEKAFQEAGVEFITYPFDIHGSDERQYSSIGFRINTATITKDKYYEYPYYHNSLDNLTFVNASQLKTALDIYVLLIKNIENLRYFKNLKPNCEVMLSRHNLYPKTGGLINPNNFEMKELDALLWILHLSDGYTDTQTIAKRADISHEYILKISVFLEQKNILKRI